MITGDLCCLTTQDIIDLDRSSLGVYTTGSRFYGGCDSSSDWDFYAEHSRPVIEELQRLGFLKRNPSRKYWDCNFVEVWEKQGAQVILVKNRLARSLVDDHVKNNGLYRRDQPASWWDQQYKDLGWFEYLNRETK